MDRFDRQHRIPAWDQERLRAASVMVCGRGWLGTFTVWGLASMGVGEILWVGEPEPATEPVARWFLASPSPFPGCAIHDYAMNVEFGGELDWIVAGRGVGAVLACSDARSHAHCVRIATVSGAAVASGTAGRGGWVGGAEWIADEPDDQGHPVTAMVAAALLVENTREALMPLRGGRAAIGGLRIAPPPFQSADRALLVGIGGIGTYAATLAAVIGIPVHMKDHDRIDTTNLNRQGLFAPADAAAARFKSEAALSALRRFFPAAQLSCDTGRAGAAIDDDITSTRSTLLLSAVDNAATRLRLQQAARQRRMPIVQAGTDVFAADVFSQGAEGPTLDDQMHGVMTRSAAQEGGERRRRACTQDPSYVVPGMIAAGLMVYRALQLADSDRGRSPIHWRAGDRPIDLQEPHDDNAPNEYATADGDAAGHLRDQSHS
jgi:molybdopterin/thiamine biosynthesis adenylyltransferase